MSGMLGYSFLVDTNDVKNIRMIQSLADTFARGILRPGALFLGIRVGHMITVPG
jgi:hypothetical protein